MFGIIIPIIGVILLSIELSRKHKCTRESIYDSREQGDDLYFDYQIGCWRYIPTNEVCVILYKEDGVEYRNPKTNTIIKKFPPLNTRNLHKPMSNDEWAQRMNETYKQIGKEPPYFLNKEGHYERKIGK